MKTFIKGVPYCKSKNRGDTTAPVLWTAQVMVGCKSIPKQDQPCELDVDFVLPEDKYPPDFPHGPDLDNLLKRLLDAIQDSGVLQNDSLIIRLTATKRKAAKDEATGVQIEFRPEKG